MSECMLYSSYDDEEEYAISKGTAEKETQTERPKSSEADLQANIEDK